ncbi:MAG: hypothetical protein LUI08_01760 [Prevotella sp.]|nr:hypothetical protein [Prevotella sp.]
MPEDAGVAYANTAGWNVFDVMLEDTVTITPDAQDGDYYYGTRFSPYSYTLQEGEEGAIISANGISADDDGGTLNLSWDYQSGDVVPANTALLIRSATLTSYANPVVEATDDEVNNTTTDLLCGNVKDGVGYWSTYDTETGQTTKKDVTTYVSYDNEADPADYYFYKLTYGADGTANADVLGFYWATHSQTNSEEDGAPFTVNGKHAWLAIPKSTFNNLETASLPLNKMETTGIKVVDTTETATDAIYNLQGMRLSDMSRKGLYIVNGTKVIKK